MAAGGALAGSGVFPTCSDRIAGDASAPIRARSYQPYQEVVGLEQQSVRAGAPGMLEAELDSRVRETLESVLSKRGGAM